MGLRLLMSAENAGKPLRNAKHEAVALAYFADPERIGWRCYASVYANSSEAAAKTAFSRLLKNADFTARLAALGAGVAEKVSITIENVINELAKLGFANMEDYCRVNGEGIPVVDLSRVDRDKSAAIQQFAVETYMDGHGDDAREVKKITFKLHDKRGPLVDIGKHLGAFIQKVELTGKDGGPIEVKEAEMSELELARRIAFALEQGARAAPKLAPVQPAPAVAPKKAKPKPVAPKPALKKLKGKKR